MALLHDLQSGELGLSVTAPDDLDLTEESDSHAAFVDPQTGLRIWLLFSDGTWLDPSTEHREHLLAHMRWHTRAMLQHTSSANQPPPDGRLRTDDPEWQALIEVDDDEVDGAPALWTAHRMLYHSGRELIMAHLMVPVDKGLFEIRLAASEEGATGYRESAVLMTRQLTGPEVPGDPFYGLRQPDYDDPAHDEAFPQHPLSRVRAARAGLAERFGLQVSVPAGRPPEEVALATHGGTFRPPPRFTRIADLPQGPSAFRRCSVCASDGLEHLYVRRARIEGDSHAIADLMFERLQEDHLEQGIRDVDAEMSALPERDGLPRAFGTVNGTSLQGPLTTAAIWFAVPGGDVVQFDVVGGVPERPREDYLAELTAAADSWVERAKPKKRWWWPF